MKGRPLMKLSELQAEGLSYREIARQSGHSRNTVRRYLRDEAGKNVAVRQPKGSKLDPFKGMIDQLVSQGLYSTPAIIDRIRPLGFEGSETFSRDYVRSIRPSVSTKVVIARRYETAPGSQLQFDWGIFSYIDSKGKERRVPGLFAILGYSRRSYVEFAHSADIYGLTTALVNAFYYFGGLTNAVLTDHMKTVVLGGDGDGGWNYHPQMEDLARYLGISIKLCQVRRPETKGKVERHIRYVKENFWPGRVFQDLFDLNIQVQDWCSEERPSTSGKFGRTPQGAFEDERLNLKPLPPREELRKLRAPSSPSIARWLCLLRWN